MYTSYSTYPWWKILAFKTMKIQIQLAAFGISANSYNAINASSPIEKKQSKREKIIINNHFSLFFSPFFSFWRKLRKIPKRCPLQNPSQHKLTIVVIKQFPNSTKFFPNLQKMSPPSENFFVSSSFQSSRTGRVFLKF